jgi:small multidrug resistance pump
VRPSNPWLLLAQVVQTLPLGLTDALWSGIGILAIALVGVLAYWQIPTPGQILPPRFLSSQQP